MSETVSIPNLRGASASSVGSGLTGLPQRLVQDGVVSEADARAALDAAREKKSHFVTQLVGSGAASARDIAIAASSEFGVPLFDLDSLQVDMDLAKLVSEKLLAKHRVLPMFRRGKRLFLGVSDPTDLHAIDEIKFQTSMSVDAIVVEDDKLQKLVDKAIETAESSVMPDLGEEEGLELEGLEAPGATNSKPTASPATTSTTPPSSATSTSCCSTPSARAPRTSTSSPTRRCTGCATASTAC
jgi:type IV pilus assembly protein PilB